MGRKRSSQGTSGNSAIPRPYYNRDLRELWWGNELVKHFKQRAPDQHLILSAFEEQGWPRRIDDPLSPRSHEANPKRRLNGAIYRLNLNQLNRLIRFRGDGTGEGVLWEPRRA